MPTKVSSQLSSPLRNKSKRILLLVVLLLALSSYLVFDYIEAQPSFCNSCHEMNFYYVSWLNSTHDTSANCLSCHSEPFPRGELDTKIRGITELIAHIRGDYKLPITSAVSLGNNQCTLCHPLTSEAILNIDVPHVIHVENGLLCVDCHSKVVHHEPNEPTVITNQECAGCHTSHVGTSATFPLTGAHSKLQCIDCHNVTLGGLSVDCVRCHTPPSTHDEVDTNCVTCHTFETFTPSTYQHPQVDEHLLGEEVLQCASCHRPEYSIASCTGAGCHASDNPRGDD